MNTQGATNNSINTIMDRKEIYELIDILSGCQFDLQYILDNGVNGGIRESAEETLIKVRAKRADLYEQLTKETK